MRIILFLSFFLSCNVINTARAESPATAISKEDLFYDDSDWQSLEVSEGELRFIEPITDKSILHSDTVLKISENSLTTGWVAMTQCYSNLDAVTKTDVVYRYKKIKQLTISQLQHIEDARINDQTIELTGVGQAARLCVTALINILVKTQQGGFALTNGPYHRKFLDGYYPYHVSLTISYPAEHLTLQGILPARQALFSPSSRPGKLFIDTWFEGILQIEIKFSKP